MRSKNEVKTVWKNPITWVCLFAVGYWVYRYHFEHAMGVLPYAILLLCPLMHIFMHHGHGHSDQGDKDQKEERGGYDAR